MKFTKRKQRTRVDWRDGAVLLIEQPLREDLFLEWPELAKNSKLITEQTSVFYIRSLRAAIVGWEGIENAATGKPLEFNAENRAEIADALLIEDENAEVLEKIKIALKGPLANLATGSTASSTMDGDQTPPAPSAPEKGANS